MDQRCAIVGTPAKDPAPRRGTVVLLLRNTSGNIGGIERQILQIASGLQQVGRFQPILATNSAQAAFAQAFADLGLPVEECPHLSGSTLSAARELASVARRRGARLIQSHQFRESIVARYARFLNGDLCHISRVHTYIDCSWIPGWKKSAYHALERLTSRGVDHYVPISHDVARELAERSGIQPARITVVPDGVRQAGAPDAPDLSPTPLSPRLAMVSNFVEHKGHEVLVRCLAALKAQGLIVRARLVGGEGTGGPQRGDGPVTARVRSLAAEAGVLDQMEFFGYSENVYEAIRDIPLIVLPSDSEGLPNCILEAMSLRKIVAVSRVGGVPEILTQGVNGLLHAPQDHLGLAALIARVFSTPARDWEALRNQALATWRDRFSEATLRENLIAVYQHLGVIQ